MTKVLVICSEFRDYGKFLKKVFEKNGCITKLISTPMIGIRKYDFVTRFKRKIGCDISYYYNKIISNYSNDIASSFNKFKPDVVFINLGNMVNISTIKMMSNSAYMVLNMPDPLKRVEEIKDTLKYYNRIYTYEKTDIKELQENTSSKIGTMFGLFDPTVYHPLKLEKKYDIYFVGAIYPFRAILLTRIIEDFPNLNILIDGNYKDFKESKRIINKKKKNIKIKFTNKNIPSDIVNERYNQSKIILNLQHPQTKDGWNSRLVEILGTNSFEIVTRNGSVCEEFSGCLEMYSDYEELKEKINLYIKDEKKREDVADNGYKKALKEFTYDIAIKKMLKEIYEEINYK